ncbi:MAG: DUF1428 domain-containing protein [Alphaproteobacteria bacterium]|nr:DUF1428 domain-containing protein [Alphaproteobacteria bacterium]QQS57661.1 MAG: DUF1428 domain-containing protein [Alphaproteobacteria bacterium]
MTYVDGFVVPVPEGKINEYKKMAAQAGKIWMEHGALAYVECVGEDLEDKGFCKTFPDAFKTKKGETVVFAYIVYKSRAHRDKVNAKVMADERMKCLPDSMPFDCKRMAYGGFKALVAL